MAKIQARFRLFALLAFVLMMSAVAQAQAARNWVSGVGDDVNTCSRTFGAVTVNSYSNNRFAGNGGSRAVVAIGARSHDTGQQ